MFMCTPHTRDSPDLIFIEMLLDYMDLFGEFRHFSSLEAQIWGLRLSYSVPLIKRQEEKADTSISMTLFFFSQKTSNDFDFCRFVSSDCRLVADKNLKLIATNDESGRRLWDVSKDMCALN